MCQTLHTSDIGTHTYAPGVARGLQPFCPLQGPHMDSGCQIVHVPTLPLLGEGIGSSSLCLLQDPCTESNCLIVPRLAGLGQLELRAPYCLPDYNQFRYSKCLGTLLPQAPPFSLTLGFLRPVYHLGFCRTLPPGPFSGRDIFQQNRILNVPILHSGVIAGLQRLPSPALYLLNIPSD